LLDPGAVDIVQCLAGPIDAFLDRILEALFRASDYFGDFRNGHNYLPAINNASLFRRWTAASISPGSCRRSWRRGKSGLVASKPAGVGVKVEARALRGAPDLYILAAGVNDYADVKHKPNFAVSDAKDLSEALADAGSTFYRHKPQVVMLRDDEVTADRLSAVFKELGAKIKANDVFLFFIAGHGKTIGGDYYFLTPKLTRKSISRSLRPH
jgi:hypothetical protein